MNWKSFVAALIVIPILDYIWLGMIMSGFYTSHLGELGRNVDGRIKPVMWAAGVVYLLLALGISALVVPQLSVESSLIKTFGYGAILGLVVYGVYDFTNHATLVRWPLAMVAADVAWGAFVCGIAALAARHFALPQ